MESDPSRTYPALARRLTLEGMVIVASILAAFALDTWWDQAQERREERETLEALRAEFSAARESIVRYRSLQERILQSVSAVADSLHGAYHQGRPQVTLPDTALGWAFIPPTTTVSLGTLQGLIGAGRLGLIRDPELRAALGGWGTTLAELSEEEIDSRDFAHGDLNRALRARVDTYGLWSTASRLFNGTLDPEGMAAARVLPVDTEILGAFELRADLLRHTIDEFEPLMEEVDSILAGIDRSTGKAGPTTSGS